ncbi:DUF3626 domain-containing protein [Hamadaea tsunoensis]|uniref:DUF3626 domain-containing protein n=1 Tax=Hamadaea tsunoensis TaxID=53368 RepID=UPI00041299EE|nr:DUF3626 domain-containing protein [Hamadaea tsunoensis]
MVELTPSQTAALAHVRDQANARRQADLDRLADLPDLRLFISRVRVSTPVTLNFHPDRQVAEPTELLAARASAPRRRTVAEALSAEGVYRGQFETGISNGGRTAYPGGDRDLWEQRLFGDAYHAGQYAPAERPKYGALNLAGHADGASPRFGSCHVRLRPEVNERCTFTVGDSHLGPADTGTIDAFEPIVAGLRAGGAGNLGSDLDLLTILRAQPLRRGIGRALDEYVEAQVHGTVEIARDVDAFVLDPSFAGTPSADHLADLADRCGVVLEWHAGYEIAPEAVDDEFRGPEMPAFAALVAKTFDAERLTAEVLGRAAAAVGQDPAAWSSWGTPDETRQLVKYLWHILVAFGTPFSR